MILTRIILAGICLWLFRWLCARGMALAASVNAYPRAK